MSLSDLVRAKLQRHPELHYEEVGGGIRVFAANPEGFPVTILQNGGHYTVWFAGWHEHFSSGEEALKCFASGLSERCRLRLENEANATIDGPFSISTRGAG